MLCLAEDEDLPNNCRLDALIVCEICFLTGVVSTAIRVLECPGVLRLGLALGASEFDLSIASWLDTREAWRGLLD